jgi:iron complex outermembrane receptor protein
MLLAALLIVVPQDSGTNRLPTVQVTVAREPARPALELPFALSRVFPDSARPGLRNASVDERLFLIPGVIIANRNNPTQDPRIAIRGFGSRSAFGVRGVRVQMDGIPLTLPDGQTAIDYLDLESIGSLEIIRGSASSLYGNAAGGVIDLRSKAAPDEPLAPSARAWLAANRQSRFAVSAAGSNGSSEYVLSVSRMQTDGSRDHALQRVTNGSLSFATDLGRLRLSATVLGHDMPLAENPGALTLDEMRDDIRNSEPLAVQKRARKEVSQLQGGITLTYGDPSNKGELELTVHGGTRDLNNPLQFAIVTVDRASYGASLRASRNYSLGSRPARVTLGFDFQSQNDNRVEYTNCNPIATPPTTSATCPVAGAERGTLRRDQKETIRGTGPYAHGELALSSRLLLSAGVRADQISFEVRDALVAGTNPDDSGERTLRAVSPMFGAVLRVAPLQSIYLNYSTAFETPTATELGNKPDGSAGFNPELDPQRSATVEAGTRGWLDALLPTGVSYDLAVYRTRVRDELIGFEIPGGAGRRFFRNAGSTLRLGLEASLAAQAGPAMFNVSYTYSHFRFEDYEAGSISFDDKRIPGIPIQQLQAAVTLREAWWYATIEGETRGAVYLDDANSGTSGGYQTMNLRLGSEGLPGMPWLAPRVGVHNVFDRVHAASISVNASSGRYYEPAPGRSVFVGLSLTGMR